MGSPQCSCRKEQTLGVGKGKRTRPCSHGRSVQSPGVTNLSCRQLCSEAQAVISGPENSSKAVPENPPLWPAVLFSQGSPGSASFVSSPSFPSGPLEWGVKNALGDPAGQRSSQALSLSPRIKLVAPRRLGGGDCQRSSWGWGGCRSDWCS